MNEITIPEYILDNAIDAIRMAANALDSRKRETAMDRQIEYVERLLKWVKDGKIGNPPKWIP
jgi:hypothetical protein